VAFNIKFGLIANGYELIHRKTDIYFYNQVALGTSQMMMVIIPANTIMMCPVSKLYTIQQTHSNQLLYGTINRSSTQARL